MELAIQYNADDSYDIRVYDSTYYITITVFFAFGVVSEWSKVLIPFPWPLMV